MESDINRKNSYENKNDPSGVEHVKKHGDSPIRLCLPTSGRLRMTTLDDGIKITF